MSEELLVLKQVHKYFPVKRGMLRRIAGYVRAVDGIDLTVRKGECFGLVGESGSGKTTLGRLIVRLLDADSGQITFQGREIARLSPRLMSPLRSRIQMVFQDPFGSLDPRYTVEMIIAEGMIGSGRSRASSRKDKVRELLRLVELAEDMADRFPHEFSGGERQRIAIARSLATSPVLLVLDEAVSSLDILVQADILQLLKGLQQQLGITYLFIAHNLRVIKNICQRVAVMYKGKMVEVGSSDDIFNRPQHPYARELLTAALDFKIKDKTVSDFFTEETTGCCYNKNCEIIEERCLRHEPGLKEVAPGHWVSCYLS